MTTTLSAARPTILIATARPEELATLADALEREGLRTHVVESAARATAAVNEGGIDLIVADMALADGSGLALCEAIKTDDATRHLSVFIMTDAPNPIERQRSSESGACAYVEKPVDAAVLLAKIRAQLALCSTLVRPQMPLRPDPALHALQVNYHALLAGSPDAVVLLDVETGRLLDVNDSAQQLFGRDEGTLLAHTLAGLCAPLQPDGEPSTQTIADAIARVLAGEIRVFEATFQHARGYAVPCEMRLVVMPIASRRLMHARLVDITRRRLDDRLRNGQGMLLEMVARGAPLVETLERLMLLIEEQSDDVLCSVLLLDDDGVRVHPAAGPSLPATYMQELEGLPIGPAAGSCGTAMYRKETVIVNDIVSDPLWAPYRDMAARYGLRACWSTPIYLDKRQVLGSFAMYYRDVRSPREDDMRLIDVASHLAGIAIDRTRRERELAQYRHHLEELVGARTAELTTAKSRAESASADLETALANLSLAQEELVRRDKLAALGTLVAGIAHELNTPIGNSLVMATTMAERTQALAANVAGGLRKSTMSAYLEQAEQAGAILVRNLTRAADLVASFKQIAVDHTGSQRRGFSLNFLLHELVPPFELTGRQHGVEVGLAIDGDIDMDSYPGPLAQALSNVFDNCLVHAFDSDAAGHVHISAAMRTRDTVSIGVSDDGAGIAPDVLTRVYDPFFTTKLGSGGSGLGLHVAHNIVTGILGGRIELASELGVGSTFTLLLPVRAPAAGEV